MTLTDLCKFGARAVLTGRLRAADKGCKGCLKLERRSVGLVQREGQTITDALGCSCGRKESEHSQPSKLV